MAHYHICAKSHDILDGFLLSVHNCESEEEAKDELRKNYPDRKFVAIVEIL